MLVISLVFKIVVLSITAPTTLWCIQGLPSNHESLEYLQLHHLMANSVAVAIKPRISPDHAGLDPLASSWKQSHGRLTGTHGTQIRRNEGLLQPRAEKTLTKQDEIKRLAGKSNPIRSKGFAGAEQSTGSEQEIIGLRRNKRTLLV